MNILALIPARAGSKGVLKKNIKLLENHPLVAYTIAAAKLSKGINRVIVSTDSKEIADIALKYDAEVPFLRPSELSTDKSMDIEYVQHTLEFLKERENYIPDLIVLLRPTTPIREFEYIDRAIEKLSKNSEASSLRSSHVAAESPFKWYSKEGNFYTPICDKYTLEDTNRPRQAFKDVYIPNGYVDILKPSFIKENNSMYGEKILEFITPHGYEVDTIEEFNYIEYLISKDEIELMKYLDKRV